MYKILNITENHVNKCRHNFSVNPIRVVVATTLLFTTLANNEIPQSSICQIPSSRQVIMGYTWPFNIHNHVSL